MDKPVILLTFANDQDEYLPLLKRESMLINLVLAVLEDSNQIKIHREESASADILLNALERFDQQIAIFHYGGHAGGQHLLLEGTEGHAEGLAQLLSKQASEGLQLVFLNGCSTEGQVKRLLELGVKAVIATSVSVQDDKAVEFAYRFYRKLAYKGSIQKAFEAASDALQLKYEGIHRPALVAVNTTRDLAGAEGEPSEAFPWQLLYNENHPEVLNWTIPLQRLTIQRPDVDIPYEVNDYIYPILEAMVEYQPEIEKEIERLEDEREYLDLIIKNFPWNIGSQIKILVSTDPTMNKPQLSRLKQIISTYVAVSQFLYYTLMSQLTGKYPKKDHSLVKDNLERLFEVTAEDFLTFNFLREFQEVMAKLEKGKIEPFVIEFKDIFEELFQGRELFDVCQYLQSLKEHLTTGNTEELEAEIFTECADAEYALGYLLKKMAFIVNYQMVTVRDISISNPWHRETRFRHQMGRLYSSADDQLRLFKEPRAYGEYLENSSILLLKNLDKVSSFLSLSPFYIDRNAFGSKEATATDLHTYGYTSGTSKETKDFHYFKSNHSIFSVLEKKTDQIHTREEVRGDIKRTRFKGRLRKLEDPGKRRPYGVLQEQFEDLLEL